MAEATAARAIIESADRLVPIQFGILYGCLADASNTVYLGQWCGAVDGRLDLPLLERAWRRVVARHSILRTAFDWQLKAEPLQIVLREVETGVEIVDFAADLPVSLDDERVQGFLARDRARGFDLTRPPLMRLSVLRLSAERHVLVWTRHHLTCDGWSLAVMFGELFTIYAALQAGQTPTLPTALPYAGYVAWWHNQDTATAKQFWSERLAAYVAAAPEPVAAGSQPAEFRQLTRALDPARLSTVRAACRAYRITLNTLVQGAWALALGRHRDGDAILFGATETIRPDDEDEDSVRVGPQINTIPVAIAAFGDTPVAEWLRGIQAMAVAGRRHGRLSLSEIAAACGMAHGRALFDSVLIFQNYPVAAATLPESTGLRLGAVDDVSVSDLPLNLIVEPGDELMLRLIYDSRQISDDAAEALLRSLADAIDAVAAAGAAPLWSVDIRPDLVPAATSRAALPAETGPTVLHQIAAAPAHQCALISGDTRVTFGELVGRAKRAALGLARRFGRGRRIGLLCTSSVDSIVALLAIQWSGGAYVPLDPGLPAARLAGMIEDAAITAIVTDPAANPAALAGATDGIPVAPFSLFEEAAGEEEAPAFPAPDALAYIIFTSGSTGRPKGVAVPHRALYASVNARPAVYPEPIRAALLSFPLIFDGSVLGLFATLTRGATVVLPDPSPVQDAISLCRTIARVGVTHTVMIPSLHAAVLDSAAAGQLDSLRACGVAGEACDPLLVRRHLASLPQAALVNEYGPTEATVWATAHRCAPTDDAGPVPIGRAVDGTRIYLLDRHLRPALPGTPGEIFIGGGSVTWGYVGNAAMTAERFLPDPWSGEPGARIYRTGDLAATRGDGAIVFLGRGDQQIKLRGYRIEPGEIEAVLLGEAGIAEAVVLLVETPMPRLVAYVTARATGGELDAAALTSAVAARLPAYMVPAIMVLPTLPRLTSGKLDRRALPLPELGADADGDDTPPTEKEAVLAALWGEVLGCGAVSVTRDFFALGGTSLLGMRLVAQIRARLGSPIELYHLFRHPTVRALAPVVESTRETAAPGATPIPRRDRQRGTAAPPPSA